MCSKTLGEPGRVGARSFAHSGRLRDPARLDPPGSVRRSAPIPVHDRDLKPSCLFPIPTTRTSSERSMLMRIFLTLATAVAVALAARAEEPKALFEPPVRLMSGGKPVNETEKLLYPSPVLLD